MGKIAKQSAHESAGKIETKQKEIFKMWDDQIRQLIEVKETSHNKWLASKNLQDKTE